MAVLKRNVHALIGGIKTDVGRRERTVDNHADEKGLKSFNGVSIREEKNKEPENLPERWQS